MYTYHALINALSVHMIPIKLNMIFYTLFVCCVSFLLLFSGGILYSFTEYNFSKADSFS